VIAYRIWQERFAGAPSAIGSSIMVNGRPFTVIGVAPKDFLGTSVWRDDIRIPLARDEKAEVYRVAASDWLGLVGRLEPGVSVETAQAIRRCRHAEPRAGFGANWERPDPESLVPGDRREHHRRPHRPVRRGLLMACVNVASIGLSRALTRSREIVVAPGARRTASRHRRAAARQRPSCSSCLLFPLAPCYATWFVTENPYIDLDLRPDWRVLVFTLAVVFVAAIVAGLTPALQVLSTK
jgi:hypothetical protein